MSETRVGSYVLCDRCTNSSSFKREHHQRSIKSQTVEVTSKAVRNNEFLHSV